MGCVLCLRQPDLRLIKHCQDRAPTMQSNQPEFDYAAAASHAADELWASAREINSLRQTLSRVFGLLILARNSKDEEALQEAIDIVATATCTSLDF